MITIGFNIETIDTKNIKFISWDVGGADKIRVLWKPFYKNISGIIFVIDSTDKERADCAREQLLIMLEEEELKENNIPLLVFANKQDKEGGMTISEITDILDLKNLKGREWHIQGTCAVTGDGLHDGINWLCQTITSKQ